MDWSPGPFDSWWFWMFCSFAYPLFDLPVAKLWTWHSGFLQLGLLLYDHNVIVFFIQLFLVIHADLQ